MYHIALDQAQESGTLNKDRGSAECSARVDLAIVVVRERNEDEISIKQINNKGRIFLQRRKKLPVIANIRYLINFAPYKKEGILPDPLQRLEAVR